MEDKELSQWFDINEQKPWELGVYEVREECDIGKNQKWYSYWNGKKFMYYTHISEQDAFEEKSKPTGCITSHWRGLASNLSAKPQPKQKGNRKVTRYVVMRKSDPPAPVATYSGWIHAARKSNDLTISTPFRYYVVKIRFRTPEA